MLGIEDKDLKTVIINAFKESEVTILKELEVG